MGVRCSIRWKGCPQFGDRLHFDFGWAQNSPTIPTQSIQLRVYFLTKKQTWRIRGARQRRFSKPGFFGCYRRKNGQLKLFCVTEFSHYDDIFNMIFGAMGEEWERLGFVRVHAALFDAKDGPVLFEGPPGAGKSTWTWNAICDHRSAWTDEYTLTRGGEFFGLPLPVSLRANELDTIPIGAQWKNSRKIKVRLEGYGPQCVNVRRIMVPAGRLPRLRFLWRTVIGIGNIQMAVYRFRTDGLFDLVVTLLRRTWTAWGLIQHFPFDSRPDERPRRSTVSS